MPGRVVRAVAAVAVVAGLQVALPAPAALAATCSTTSLTITRISGGELDVDTTQGHTLSGGYAGYAVATSGPAVNDLWVRVANFAGGTIGLAPHEDGLVHLGPLTSAAARYAYVYLAASAFSVGQTHDVELFEGQPGHGGSQLCSDTFSLISTQTIAANANKVETVVAGPSPAQIGGVVTITVTGETGQVGQGPAAHPDGAGTVKANPATDAAWPADAYQLVDASITFDTAGPFDHTLIVDGLDGTAQNYTAVYTFLVTGATATPTAVSPVNQIASGAQIKHTDTDATAYTALAPIQPPQNQLTAALSTSPTSLTAAGGRVTYTVTLHNAGSVSASLDDVTSVLPAGAAYVGGSSDYNGSAIASPEVSGRTLTWVGVFSVPAHGDRQLIYQADLPATVANQVTTATGHVGATPIDTTLPTTDSAPASASVAVGDPDDPPSNDDPPADEDPPANDPPANDPAVNGPPAYTGAPSITVAAGGVVPPLAFTDPDGNPYTVTLLAGVLPPGLTLNPNGTWTGTASGTGSYPLTVRACDSATPPACTEAELTLALGPGQLADTGAGHLADLTATGVALLAAGRGLVLVARRRPSAA